MKITRVIVGELEENCYILEKDGKVLIIDPGDEADKIISYIRGKVIGILVTHYHFDHIGALDELKEKYNIIENDFNVKEFDFEVIETPGHTNDSRTYYFKNDEVMFVGDFLFKSSIGRTDLPTGSKEDMIKSLNKIFSYPLNTIIYPGHGDKTTLKEEKINNYFVKSLL